MGSLFSGSTESKVKIPEWLEAAARSNLGKAQDIASIGYTPYYGADVAAFNPMQTAGFQNTADASRAFGLSAPTDAMAGMPQAQNFGGVMGYSSQPLFSDAVSRFGEARPGQKSLIDSLFIDPISGAQGTGTISQSGTNAPFTPSTPNVGSTTMDQAQQQDINSTPAVIPESPYNPPAYNQQEQQQIMQDELAAVRAEELAAQQAMGNQPVQQAPAQPVYDPMANITVPSGGQSIFETQPIAPTIAPNVSIPQPLTAETLVPNANQAMSDYVNATGTLSPEQPEPTFFEELSQGAMDLAGDLGNAYLDYTPTGMVISGLMDAFGDDPVESGISNESFASANLPSMGQDFTQPITAEDIANINLGYSSPLVGTPAAPAAVPQFETIVVDDRPVLTAPNSFYNAGNMLDQSPATQSTVKNLFDELDKTNGKRKPPKQIKRNFNKVR